MNKQTNASMAAIAIKNGPTMDQLPKYGDKYYLQDWQEFILMLHNPTQDKIAAKIYINGNAQKSMIVLKPGQRVWLERFVDEDQKFVFEPYTVDDTPEGRAATEKNGKVRVEFFKEDTSEKIIFVERTYLPYYPPVRPNPHPQFPGWPYYPDTTTHPSIMYNSNLTVGGTNNYSAPGLYSSDEIPEVTLDCFAESNVPQMKTGRIEKGEASGQQLHECNDEFENTYFDSVEFKLLPEMYKPAESVKVYCTKCRRVKKKGDVFCAKCGTKY